MQKTRNYLKKTILTLALSVGLMVPVLSGTVHASLFDGAKGETCAGAQLTTSSGPNCSSQSEKTISNRIETVLNLLTVVAGIISVVMIIISGVRFVTAAGDTNQITSARNTLIYALAGLVIIALAQIIVKLVLSKIG